MVVVSAAAPQHEGPEFETTICVVCMSPGTLASLLMVQVNW